MKFDYNTRLDMNQNQLINSEKCSNENRKRNNTLNDKTRYYWSVQRKGPLPCIIFPYYYEQVDVYLYLLANIMDLFYSANSVFFRNHITHLSPRGVNVKTLPYN